MGLRKTVVVAVGVAVLAGVGSLGTAGVYKWTDADGRVHFSDNPPAKSDAEEVKIRTITGPAQVSSDTDYGPRQVKLLTTTWCGVCKKAKAYLVQKGIFYREYDVETSEVGRLEYRRLSGKGVPIILVGNQKMVGFSAEKLEVLLKNVGY